MPLRRRGGLARRHPNRRAPIDVSRAGFEELVELALDGLPQPFTTLLQNVAIVIEDEPWPDD